MERKYPLIPSHSVGPTQVNQIYYVTSIPPNRDDRQPAVTLSFSHFAFDPCLCLPIKS